ncbi:MAG: hypothetical protein KF812_01490 [Fimbriimonadaceae bacterium]|nr:hypothetical protein [Fimbriimonadaceae bacterium]
MTRLVKRGTANPERMAESFWEEAVRNQLSAYSIKVEHGGSDPVWCFERFGMTCTLVERFQEPKRHIWIAGEHEDSYDPDFYIYNDVIITAPDGSVAIYGYPVDIFPPTDFHTATLVGDIRDPEAIYIIGRLGYHGDRFPGTTPIYRLGLPDLMISEITVRGEEPSWLHNHSALYLPRSSSIAVWGGNLVDVDDQLVPNHQPWLFDLVSSTWSKINELDLRRL